MKSPRFSETDIGVWVSIKANQNKIKEFFVRSIYVFRVSGPIIWVLGLGIWVLGLGSHETRHMKIRLDIGHTHMTGPGTQDQISVPNVDKSF